MVRCVTVFACFSSSLKREMWRSTPSTIQTQTGTAVVLEETLLRIDFNTYMHKDLQLGRTVQAQSTRPPGRGASSLPAAAARHRCGQA